MAVKLCQASSSLFGAVSTSGNHAVKKTELKLSCSFHLSSPLQKSCRKSLLKHARNRNAGLLALSRVIWSRPSLEKEPQRICTAEYSAEMVRVVGNNNGGIPSQDGHLEDDGGSLSAASDDLDSSTSWMEATIERLIFNCRFWALFAVAGSLAGSFLCYLKGMLYVGDAFVEYFSHCLPLSAHTGKVILLLVEAVDVFLVGTVLLIFGFGIYELFVGTVTDRALRNSSLFGMFRLKAQPRWMIINSLDELKTKIGHVVIMILLVGMFEKSKKVLINNTWDLVAFSFSILVASLALFVMHLIHKF